MSDKQADIVVALVLFAWPLAFDLASRRWVSTENKALLKGFRNELFREYEALPEPNRHRLDDEARNLIERKDHRLLWPLCAVSAVAPATVVARSFFDSEYGKGTWLESFRLGFFAIASLALAILLGIARKEYRDDTYRRLWAQDTSGLPLPHHIEEEARIRTKNRWIRGLAFSAATLPILEASLDAFTHRTG